ncbi:alpha-hydroxy acid oxidase [Candidatus Poriferisocius sp.]|uniref:alpha-hydroxy acid oxidase n=1 Tax=Candidatus Poriferisocius sp. TaxID=3101276 RepID=UPI003B5A8A51
MKVRDMARMLARTPKGAARWHTYEDFRQAARRRLPTMVFDFVEGGAEGEVTVAANRSSIDAVELAPSYLVDVADREVSTTVLGAPVSMPYLLAPAGLATLVHREGELAAARAAAAAGTVFAVSTGSGYSLEDIAEAAPDGRRWFQLYLWKSPEVVRSLVNRARDAGYEALVLTVDVPVVGKRERDLRNGMSLPPRIRWNRALDTARRPGWLHHMVTGPDITFGSLVELGIGDDASAIGAYVDRELADPARTWQDVAWLRREWEGPLLVKGVITVADAEAAAKWGADGVIVSNHGGRQLDSVPGAFSVLPRIAEAVGDRVEVLVDGGCQRGSDVVKARALGARAAMGGRSWFWPLAVAGEPGVARMLDIFRADIDRTLALIGRRRFDDIDPTILT